jgi:tetratricopeptide (TPR) repeat protein
MNTDLETIENYVTGQLAADERARFEDALRTDPAVADALTFYMLSKYVAREEAHTIRKAELDALRRQTVQAQPFWSAPIRWVAAASIVLLLGLGLYFFQSTNGPANSELAVAQLTDAYVAQHFTKLSTTMDGGSSGSNSLDSLKQGINLFNKGMLAEADVVFQDVLKRQPDMNNALLYAGIVSFQRGNYDQAINQFHQLSQRTYLYANPGLFYESLALLKRGRPMDKESAKKLLEEVINKNLGGKKEAASLRSQL